MKGEKIEATAPPAAAAPGELDSLAGAAASADLAGTPPAAPGVEPAPAVDLPATHKIVEMLLQPTFILLAPNWKVKPEEIEQLSIAYGAVIDKYFPDLRAGPELAAALITAAVFAPRVVGKVPPNLEPPKPAKEPEKKPKDDEPVTPPTH